MTTGDFLKRFSQPRPLLLDGAMGTELTRRGVDTTLPLWSGGALKNHPAVVQQIHEDYLQAGADIITTNTFRTHTRNLKNADEARRLTHLAVELAQKAAQNAIQKTGRKAFIAGSVAPLEDCYSPQLTPAPAACQREQAIQVKNLVDGGVDFCLIETMNTVHEAHAAAQAARNLTIPFMVSVVVNEHYHLLSGESLRDALTRLTPLEPLAILINCIPTRHITQGLRILRSLTTLPIGAYGNAGTPDDVVGWAASDDVTPHIYCEQAEHWLSIPGIKIIGSCCETMPAHTAALRKLIDSRFPESPT